jgi:hypothetical protein
MIWEDGREERLGKDVEGGGHSLFHVNDPALAKGIEEN